MKKILGIVLLSATLLFIILYFAIGIDIKYEELAMEDAPASIQDAIQENEDKFTFLLEKGSTYIYYKSNHKVNEYISTDLKLKWKGGNYVATGTISNAVNDKSVNYDKLIKLDKVLDEQVLLRVKDQR
ncbi:hypothetical protein [Aquibacillus kalidii]|uniref:hypothetical protein n=1 Tax=Aquibacillus kalidii TaxID=2762597 RepID=UPI001649219F|nr:hypothetical protein [Aquibacillus kalidii]